MHSETAYSNCLNPVLQIQRSYVKTISFSFYFLGNPPRHSELPAFFFFVTFSSLAAPKGNLTLELQKGGK